jgi:hypothetical protein
MFHWWCRIYWEYVRFQFLIAACMNIAPCNLVEVNLWFRGVYCFHHQGDEYIARKMSVTDIGTDRTRYNLDRTDGKGVRIKWGRRAPPPWQTWTGRNACTWAGHGNPSSTLSQDAENLRHARSGCPDMSFSRQTGAGHPSPNSLLLFYLYLFSVFSLYHVIFASLSCIHNLSILHSYSSFAS